MMHSFHTFERKNHFDAASPAAQELWGDLRLKNKSCPKFRYDLSLLDCLWGRTRDCRPSEANLFERIHSVAVMYPQGLEDPLELLMAVALTICAEKGQRDADRAIDN